MQGVLWWCRTWKLELRWWEYEQTQCLHHTYDEVQVGRTLLASEWIKLKNSLLHYYIYLRMRGSKSWAPTFKQKELTQRENGTLSAKVAPPGIQELKSVQFPINSISTMSQSCGFFFNRNTVFIQYFQWLLLITVRLLSMKRSTLNIWH